MAGSPEGKQSFHEEYMSQYSFGEPTPAKLRRMRIEPHTIKNETPMTGWPEQHKRKKQ